MVVARVLCRRRRRRSRAQVSREIQCPKRAGPNFRLVPLFFLAHLPLGIPPFSRAGITRRPLPHFTHACSLCILFFDCALQLALPSIALRLLALFLRALLAWGALEAGESPQADQSSLCWSHGEVGIELEQKSWNTGSEAQRPVSWSSLYTKRMMKLITIRRCL